MSDVNLLIVQKHTVDGLDSGVSSFGGLVVDEAIALRTALIVGGNFARQDIAESSEGIVQSLFGMTRQNKLLIIMQCNSAHLVVDSFVQVLDEDVALTSLAESGVALGPHDTASEPFQYEQTRSSHA